MIRSIQPVTGNFIILHIILKREFILLLTHLFILHILLVGIGIFSSFFKNRILFKFLFDTLLQLNCRNLKQLDHLDLLRR